MKLLRCLFLALFLSTQCFSATEPKICEAYFSPEDHLADHLVALINKEEKSIYVAAYAFSHRQIAQALCDAKERGVSVEVIVDCFTLSFPFCIKKLAKAGIPVWVWEPAKSGGSRYNKAPIMHDKFCLLGDKLVWTGSFNFTYSADRTNQENALLLSDEALALKFKNQFQKLKERESKVFVPIAD
jgi:mitochondrial cardiolipin hydrolase